MVKDMMTKLINKCFDEDKALHINAQREKLYIFDQELVTYTAMYPGFLKWLLGSIVIIFMMVPYQVIQEEMSGIVWIVMLFGCFPSLFGFRASVLTNDDNTNVTASVYKKLMHLPIDGKVWVCVKMEYVLQFSIKLCTIAVVAQSLMSLLICKEWSWVNLVYPLMVTFMAPMILSYFDMWNQVKSCESR